MSKPVNPNLCNRLGYQFLQADLLEQALTHRSYGRNNYERLEFLGDAILNLSISKTLLARFPTAKEGDLSRLRSHLVQERTLAELARSFQLGPHLKLGEGELKTGGQDRPSILADTLEALIGAIFTETHFETAHHTITQWFTPLLDSIALQDDKKDPKTQLQEYVQGLKEPLPKYHIESITGQSHAQVFKVNCSLSSRALTTQGQAHSRRAAEKLAAEKMLKLLLT